MVSVCVRILHFKLKTHTHDYLSNTFTYIDIHNLKCVLQIHYKNICIKKGVDLKETQIQSWVEVVGGVRKNMILDFSRIRACDVL